MKYLFILVVFALMSYSVMASSTHITNYWAVNWTNLSYASDSDYDTYAASTFVTFGPRALLYANFTLPSYALAPFLSLKYANPAVASRMSMYIYSNLHLDYIWLNGNFPTTAYPNTSILNYSLDPSWYINDDNFGSFYISSTSTLGQWYYEGDVHWVDSRLDNCSNTSDEAIVFDLYSESSPSTHLTSQFQIAGSYYIDIPNSTPQISNFSYLMNGSNQYRLCYTDDGYPVRISAYVQHIHPSGFTHRYYMVNESVSGSPLNISLFNFADTTDISDLKITVRDAATYKYLPNTYGVLQRRYVGENVWRSVQMDLTGDYGQLLFHILEGNTDYRLIFLDSDYNVIRTTESMKFICTSSLCEITYLLDTSDTSTESSELSVLASYDNSSHVITIDFDDPTGRVSDISILVSKETLTGTLYLCDDTVLGSTGSYICNVSGYSGTFYVLVESTTNGLPNPEYSVFIETSAPRFSVILDQKEGAIWTVGLILVISGIGMYSPVAVIIAAIFGLFVSMLLGFIDAITIGGIIVSVVMGLVIALRVKT